LAQLRQLGAETATGDILILVDSHLSASGLTLSGIAGRSVWLDDRQRHDGQIMGRAETRDTALG
jgi:hypothetical protein